MKIKLVVPHSKAQGKFFNLMAEMKISNHPLKQSAENPIV